MTELRFGMIPDIRLDLLPRPMVVPDFFACRTDRNNSPKNPDLVKGAFQILLHPKKIEEEQPQHDKNMHTGHQQQ